MAKERTPPELREGTRSGILATLEHDVELRGGRTARLLAAAGAIGVVGAVGVTLLLSGHPFGHHPPWHVLVFTAVWVGLLVVSLALVFLQVRTPSLPLGRAAAVGILGLGMAGVCGAACPDPHFLGWWSSTPLGRSLADAGGLALSALCFGLVTSFFLAAAAAFVALGGGRRVARAPAPPGDDAAPPAGARNRAPEHRHLPRHVLGLAARERRGRLRRRRERDPDACAPREPDASLGLLGRGSRLR